MPAFLRNAAFVFAVLVGITILWGSWYTIDQGRIGVKLRNGKIVDTVEPGLGFKTPWIDEVVEYSSRVEKVDIPDVASYSKDIQQAVNHISVNYRIDPTKVKRIYTIYGRDQTSYEQGIIRPRVFEAYKEVFGQFSAADVVGRRAELAQQFSDRLIRSLPPEFVVDGIQIENIDFSDTYEQAVEAAAEMQAQTQQAEQQVKREKAQAEIKVVQANAEAAAITARGNAEASAIKARGEALRQSPELVALTAAEKWNGVLPTTMVPGGAVPFVAVPTNR